MAERDPDGACHREGSRTVRQGAARHLRLRSTWAGALAPPSGWLAGCKGSERKGKICRP